MITKIKNYFLSLIDKYITGPIKTNKENKLKLEKEEIDKIVLNEKIKKFEETFNTDFDRVTELMTSNADEYHNVKKDYYNEKLREARNRGLTNTSPMFYEPEINEIHNENLDNPTLVKYELLVNSMNINAKNTLINQEKFQNRGDNERHKRKQEYMDFLRIKKNMEDEGLIGEKDSVIDSNFGTDKFDPILFKMLKTNIKDIKNR